MGPFKEYIVRNEFEADHFYSAYPDATATMVLSALEVDKRFEVLRARAEGATPQEFGAEWRAFLRDAQRYL